MHNDDIQWLDTAHSVSIVELSEASGMSEPELRELVDYGALQPLDAGATVWLFAFASIKTVRTARRLCTTLELDIYDVCCMLALMRRIDALEAELRTLRAQMPGASKSPR